MKVKILKSFVAANDHEKRLANPSGVVENITPVNPEKPWKTGVKFGRVVELLDQRALELAAAGIVQIQREEPAPPADVVTVANAPAELQDEAKKGKK